MGGVDALKALLVEDPLEALLVEDQGRHPLRWGLAKRPLQQQVPGLIESPHAFIVPLAQRPWKALIAGGDVTPATKRLSLVMATVWPCSCHPCFMSDTKDVVLVHGSWGCGEQWGTTRATFEERGYTVYTPTLRHHELPVDEGAMKVAPLKLRDYTDDLVALVASLDSPPLLVGHSLGGLLVQLVAARTRCAGMVAACPAPAAGIFATTPTNLRMSLGHYLQSRPWAKPVYPPTYERFRRWIANTQTEEVARGLYSELVCDSGRAYCEQAAAVLRHSKATVVDFAAVTTPVLTIAGECDRIVPARSVRQTAARYQDASYVQIPRSDHFVFSGEALPATMSHIDDWIARKQVLSTA